MAWITLFSEMRFHIIHLGLWYKYTNGCLRKSWLQAWIVNTYFWNSNGPYTNMCVCVCVTVLVVPKVKGMATYYCVANHSITSDADKVLCLPQSQTTQTLVWACHHNADRITHHHVTLHPANNNGSVPPTTSSPNFHATQTSRQNWTKVLHDTKQIHNTKLFCAFLLHH